MARDDWDTDSDYRQFSPGMYAMRQLGRSVSRHTKRVLQPGRGAQAQAEAHELDAPAHEVGDSSAPYRRGPPLPSGIHRRSLSFDNLVILPGAMPRRSTEPSLGSPRSPADIRLPSASTWNSGTTMTRAAAAANAEAAASTDNGSLLPSANPDASMRRRWLAGLAHPLSTAIDSEYHTDRLETAQPGQLPMQIRFADDVVGGHGSSRGRARYRERESFSGPAQLDASANLTDSQNSVHNSSDPFQNRHMWLREDGERVRPHTSAEMRQHAAASPPSAQIVPSTPISSGLFRRPSGRNRERAAGDTTQKVRGIARVIGNISRRLNQIRSGRSASQPATPAEVRQSILDSARQNMISVPNDTGHEFYRFIVNPEEPVSDHDEPDSPTVSFRVSAKPSRHRRNPTFPSQNFAEFKRSVDAEVSGMAAHAGSSGMDSIEHPASLLPPVELAAPVLSNESFDRMYEAASHNSENVLAAQTAPSASRQIRRARSASTDAAASIEPAADQSPDPEQRATNQGHDGSISALVQEKLASEFSKSVHVSTRLISDASTESSYGTFIRFHPSGELNGIFATEARRRSSLCQVERADALPSDTEEAAALPASRPADANRYARNQESIRQFVDRVRAARQESVRRRRESESQQQVLTNDQAVLDAALYIYERQKRAEAAVAIERQQRQQGQDVPTLSTVSAEPARTDASPPATVMPARNRRRKSEGPGRAPARSSDGRRRETVFGMFCTPGRAQSPDSSLLEPNEPKDLHLKRNAATGPPRRRSNRRPISYMNKDLPPLPTPETPTGDGAPVEPLDASVPNTMKRSQSFSHFGAAADQRMSWHVRNTDSDAEGETPQRRHGFLSGILNKLAGGHARRKSMAEPAAPRKLTRRPRHPSAIDDSTEDSEEALEVAVQSEALPAPNVSVIVPKKTLSAEICADIAQCAASPALSSTHRRLYSNMLSSLSSPGDESFDTSGSHPVPPSMELRQSESHDLYPSLGLTASNVDSSRSIGRSGALQTAGAEKPQPMPVSRRAGGDGWRDSAVTGLLTQASAGTTNSPPAVAAVAEAVESDEIEVAAGSDTSAEPERYTNVVRFRERKSIVERTSTVAMDTITARDRDGWLQEHNSHDEAYAPRSMPHSHAASRIVSSSGSFADMIASAGGSDFTRKHRVPDLPGIEGFSRPASSSGPPPSDKLDLPVPTNEKLRRLESEVLFGGQRTDNGSRSRMLAGVTSCESPVSDAGTGRTRILDFAETSVNEGSESVRCRRPSARPEIKDVRGILWDDAKAAPKASAELTGGAMGLGLVDIDAPGTPTALNSLDRAATAAEGTRKLDYAGGQLLLAAGRGQSVPTPDSFPRQVDEEAHDPQRLVRLVQRSPDPRNLIYDAGSQFGSMRSHGSHGSDAASAKVPARPPLLPDMVAAHNRAAVIRKEPTSPSAYSTGIGPDVRTPTDDLSPQRRTMDEPSLHRALGTDSDALARASIQATTESPALAARRIRAQQRRESAPPGAAQESLQDYVERQKRAPSSRSTKTGTEQLNFRVSLLQRPTMPSRRARSVSLPAPQPAVLAIADAAHQRRRSFYEAPPLVQTLLLPPESTDLSARSMSQGADEDLELFSTLLGDGAATTPADVAVARRQSGAATQPLFDPLLDCGDEGVPDSVLRAYMAGDMLAVERFFEHIMQITAPASVYEGSMTDDGDWSFGVEGPPPEILAARAELAVESRDLPDMMDASAEASRIVGSGACLRGTSDVATSSPATSVPNVEAPVAEPVSPAASTGSEKQLRKIAIPRSRLGRSKSTTRETSSRASNTPAQPTDAGKADTAQSRGQIAPMVALSSAAGETQDIIDIPIETIRSRRDVIDIPVMTESTRSPPALAPVPVAAAAACFSPGRNPLRAQPEAGQRKPLPVQAMHSRRQEKQMLLAQLRVLEGMIQRTAIEEARLQTNPQPSAPRTRPAEQLHSLESLYPSSSELDYDRIHRELSHSVRQRFNNRNSTGTEESEHARPRGAEVLTKLKRGSQARAQSPFRASMLERAAVTPERHWSSKVAEPATSASIPANAADLADVAYSGRSSGSIRIDIVDDRSVPGSPTSDSASSHRVIRLSNPARFRRTAKLLAL